MFLVGIHENETEKGCPITTFEYDNSTGFTLLRRIFGIFLVGIWDLRVCNATLLLINTDGFAFRSGLFTAMSIWLFACILIFFYSHAG